MFKTPEKKTKARNYSPKKKSEIGLSDFKQSEEISFVGKLFF